MKQIISLQVGQCGNRISQSFWQQIAQQHHINQKGFKQIQQRETLENIDAFFTENSKQSYQSKAILVDLEPGAIDSILTRKYGSIHRYQNAICGRSSASSNWAKGFYGQGHQNIQYVLDSIRRQAELCQNLEGFQIAHSIAGGTGSGMGCLILDKLSDQYAGKMKLSYTVFTSNKASNCNVLQTYNSVLSFPYLIENVNSCFSIENQALFSKFDETISPTYKNLNDVVGDVISGVTCGVRFPGELNYSPRKLCVNMVPFPNMHFFIAGSSCMAPNSKSRSKQNNVAEILKNLMDRNTFLSTTDPRHGRYLTNAVIFRGKAPTYQIQSQILNLINRNSSYFIEWISNNINWTLCNTPRKGFQLSSTIIGNTTAILDNFRTILQNYSCMFRRKAFVHWYRNEGLQPQIFMEAEEKLKNLKYTYQIDYRNTIQEQQNDVYE